MHTLPCLTMLVCVTVPCCVTRSIKQHIDSNRSDLRALNTNANIGGGDSSNDNLNSLGRPLNDQDTTAADRRQMTNGNVEGKRSGSPTDSETNMNVLSNVNSETSGQRRTNSNMGRDINRTDKVVEGNSTNYSVQSGVKHGTSPNKSTKKKKDEKPNETIHAREKGGASLHLGVTKGVHQKTFHKAPPSQTSLHVVYSFLLFLAVILVLLGMVFLVVKCHKSSDNVSDSRSETFGAQHSECDSQTRENLRTDV
ncbi:uncharacterized protein LOC124277316 [Haliotis rubra]|uniref:uncharacterized protein LOC124277316 n=1 Tax=Haliotis rubra TaxID=36100 RepID=UPI001EE54AF9|nr:uncharacterized protein LOC124277316 [Haliotis rubra]